MHFNQFEEAILDAPIPGIIRSTVRKDGIRTGAVYSLEQRDDGQSMYRYVLWWVWASNLPVWLYALLNPSTATHLKLRCNMGLGYLRDDQSLLIEAVAYLAK